MTTRAAVLTSAMLAWLMFGLLPVASGQPVPPMLSAVRATIDGENVPNGTVISAWIDGVHVAEQAVVDGVAIVVIPGKAGDVVRFKIGELDAEETQVWVLGGHAHPCIFNMDVTDRFVLGLEDRSSAGSSRPACSEPEQLSGPREPESRKAGPEPGKTP